MGNKTKTRTEGREGGQKIRHEVSSELLSPLMDALATEPRVPTLQAFPRPGVFKLGALMTEGHTKTFQGVNRDGQLRGIISQILTPICALA